MRQWGKRTLDVLTYLLSSTFAFYLVTLVSVDTLMVDFKFGMEPVRIDLCFCVFFAQTEKGFCVLGDLCPFDHGSDPLIVDDVTLPKMIPFPPPPVMPPGGLPMPPITEPPPSLRMPAMPPYSQPPPPGVFPMTGEF